MSDQDSKNIQQNEVKTEQVKVEVAQKPVQNSIDQKTDEIIEQHNNYSTQTNKSQRDDENEQQIKKQKQFNENKQKNVKQNQNYQELKSQTSNQIGNDRIKQESQGNKIQQEGDAKNNKNEQGSLIDENEKVLSKARQQRVLLNFTPFTEFVQNYKYQSQKQKLVYLDIFEQVQKKKMSQYSWYNTLKDNFIQYGSVIKQFADRCEKLIKQQKADQINRYLNIGQQYRQGYQQLIHFKKITSNNYKNSYEFISNKLIKDLQEYFNKYVNQMNQIQGKVNQKKIQCNKKQQEFKKQVSKVNKMFVKANQGKKIEEDFFVETSILILLYNKYKQSFIQWGKMIIILRRLFIQFTQSNIFSIQSTLNIFKTQLNTLCEVKKTKFEQIISPHDQIITDTNFSKLITLIDADYILSTMEISSKKQINMISDQQFQKFILLHHFNHNCGNPEDLLINFVVKVFSLKDQNLQLVSTISGNLIVNNKINSQIINIINIKNIFQVHPNQQGTIFIEERKPGIIFKSKKIITLDFKNGDRAEQLMCYLGQGEINN